MKELQRTPAAPTRRCPSCRRRLSLLPSGGSGSLHCPPAHCQPAHCGYLAAGCLLRWSVSPAAGDLLWFYCLHPVAGHAGRAQLPWLSPRVPAPPMPAGSSAAAQQGAGGKLERRAGSCKQSDCPKPAVLAAPDMRVRFLAGWPTFVQQRNGMCLHAQCAAVCSHAALLEPQSLTPCTRRPCPTSCLLLRPRRPACRGSPC